MTGATCTDCAPDDKLQPMTDAELRPEVSAKVYNSLDASTFVPPPALPVPSVTIEFCERVSNKCLILNRALETHGNLSSVAGCTARHGSRLSFL